MLRKQMAIAALLALIGSAAAGAQETVRVAVSPGSRLWIEGTSNLHGWSCKAEKMDATISVDAIAASQLSVAPPRALKSVEVKVPIRSLKCGHGGMDDNLYKALNADASSEISYIMATFDAVPAAVKDSLVLKTVGKLTIAGKVNTVAMDVVAVRLPDGSVQATGMVPIKMTDYGIKPPTAIFGRLKTGDEVRVNFDLTIGAKAIANAVQQQ